MDLDCMILLHYHQTGEWLPDTWAKEKERIPSDQDDHSRGIEVQ